MAAIGFLSRLRHSRAVIALEEMVVHPDPCAAVQRLLS